MVAGQSIFGEMRACLEGSVDWIAVSHTESFKNLVNEIGLVKVDGVMCGLNLESNITVRRLLLSLETL